MVNRLVETSDITSLTFILITIATLSTAVLLIMGTGWVGRRWKLPLALIAAATIASAAHYLLATAVWLSSNQLTIAYQYYGWFISTPLQVVTLYFFARAMGHVPVGVFWRTLVAAVLMVLARFMGETGYMHSALGLLIGLVMWLYILGEVYFGAMDRTVSEAGSDSVKKGYFWLRLIVTIGWAIYPLCYFIGRYAGNVGIRALMVTYNLADFINLIAFGLIILTVGMKESVSL